MLALRIFGKPIVNLVKNHLSISFVRLLLHNGSPILVNAAQSAGILAAQIISCSNIELLNKISEFKNMLKEKVINASNEMKK